MSLFGRRPYDRRDALTVASEASKKGKQKKAIAEYQRILANDGPDPMVDHKLAMAYAESRKPKEARESFFRAARAYDDRGFIDKALAIYVAASSYLPRDAEMWLAISEAQLRKQRHADALEALLDARKHFRRKKQRTELVRLLERACQIEPWHFEATFELAQVRRKLGDRAGAHAMWEGLVERCSGRELRRVRGALFRSSPTPASFWRWLRALVSA